MTELCCF